MRAFHYIVPVWGKTYSQLFAQICLPMLLTPGNLSRSIVQPGDQFIITTLMSDWDAMRASPAFQQLQQVIMVNVIFVDGLVDFATPHGAMSECYELAMREAKLTADDVYHVFLTPDSFWSDGTFAKLAEMADAGKKVVATAGLRTNCSAMSTLVRERIAVSPENPAIALNDLIGIALGNLHELSYAHNWFALGGFLNEWPSHIYLIYEERFLIAHCFHLHPLLVKAPPRNLHIRNTIDGDYVKKLGYSLADHYVVQGEFLGVELSPENRTWGLPLGNASLSRVILFALQYANATHWHYFPHRIIYKVDPNEEIPNPFFVLEDKIVAKVMRFRWLLLPVKCLGHLRWIGVTFWKIVGRSTMRRIFRRMT